MNKPKKISAADVRNIIRNELKSLNETVDYAAIKSVVSAAEKMLTAIDAFKAGATAEATNAVTPMIDDMRKMLEEMITNPDAYVKKTQFKKVSMRAIDPKRVRLNIES